MPIVVINVGLKESFAYLRRRHVFPTPKIVKCIAKDEKLESYEMNSEKDCQMVTFLKD